MFQWHISVSRLLSLSRILDLHSGLTIANARIALRNFGLIPNRYEYLPTFTNCSLIKQIIRRRSTMASDSYKESMLQLMENNRTTKYFIEYRGFMSNHISHGLLALMILKAPIERAEKFIQFHSEKLEPAEPYRNAEEPLPKAPDSIVGKKVSFYHLFDYYHGLLVEKYSNSLDDFIAGEFQKLSSGMAGSALHGMIHLGYGYNSKLPWFVCEGMAYLHYCNFPPKFVSPVPDISAFGKGKKNILDVLDEIQKNEQLRTFVREEITKDEWARKITSNFQRKAMVLLSLQADALVNYIHEINIPEHLKIETLTSSKVPELAKWLVDSAIIVYAISERRNDFFLIHGVTCGWALKNVLPLLKDATQVKEVARCFLSSLAVAYIAQDCPKLVRELLDSSTVSYDWEYLIHEAVHHEQFAEEHVYKLVQVCKLMSEENTDPKMDAIYRKAAHICVSNPLKFE